MVNQVATVLPSTEELSTAAMSYFFIVLFPSFEFAIFKTFTLYVEVGRPRLRRRLLERA